MTKLAYPDACRSCGGVLVPPEVIPRATRDADYVCLRCGRPYRWIGNPPRLVTMLTVVPVADEDPEP